QRVAAVEALIHEQIPADEIEMLVSEIGLDPDWSAAYTANSGQQDAVIRIQLKEHRTKSSQEYAIQLRQALAADTRFNDLRVSFGTGGMVSTALNYGSSSPIDIQVPGPPELAFDAAHAIRNQIRAVPGAVDVRVLQRRDAPYLVIEVDRQKAA